jgi:hypothetical protein
MTRNPLVWLNIGITAGLLVAGGASVAVAKDPDIAEVLDVHVMNDAAEPVPVLGDVTVANVVTTEATRTPFRVRLSSSEVQFLNSSNRWIAIEYANFWCGTSDRVALRTVEGELGLLRMFVFDLPGTGADYVSSAAFLMHVPPGATLQFLDGSVDDDCVAEVSGYYN